MEEKKEKKSPRYRFNGGKGDPSEIRVKHRSFGWIYQDELTPKLVKQLKAYDKKNGTEFCLCIVE